MGDRLFFIQLYRWRLWRAGPQAPRRAGPPISIPARGNVQLRRRSLCTGLVPLCSPASQLLWRTSELPTSVHHRSARWTDVGSPGSRARSVRTCQCLRPRRTVWALAISRTSVLPSVSGTTSAPGKRVLSRLNGWPVRSPVNASPMPSQAAAHDPGSRRFATSSS